MKIKFYALTFILSLAYGASVAQDMYIDPGVGLFFNKDFTAFRANMGIHNLIAKRIGFYVTGEVANYNGVRYGRDIVGGNIRINKFLGVFGGLGIINQGLLGNEFKLSGVRKEAGVELSLLKNKLNVDLGISGSGPSVTVGYMIPVLFNAGEKTIKDKQDKEKKQADDLVNALKQLDEVKVNSAKELADARRRLADAESALKNAEAARLAAENAAKEALASKNNTIENRAITRSRAVELVNDAAAKSKANLSGAVALLNGGEMVTFKYKSSDLGKSYSSKLDQLKSFLEQSPDYSILITGHACDLGTDEANQILSEARADATRSYLISKGLPAARVVTKGMGERAPIAPNNREGNRKKNRRVDFTLLTN